MGRHMLRLLKFAILYNGWHGYGRDQRTVRALKRLCNLGLIEMNDVRQFRLIKE